jgi:hypothetical protein
VSRSRPLLSALLLTLAAANVAPVQGSSPDPLAAQLKRCAALTEAGARLACYDAVAGTVAGSVPSATVAGSAASPAGGSSPAQSGTRPTAASPSAATAGDAAPGAQAAPNVASFGVRNGPLQAKLDPVKEKRMLAVVSTVSSRSRGELVVRLDNGQVWAQIEPREYPLKPGDRVEIDVAALGSYLLWCPSTRRATKVTRIQ